MEQISDNLSSLVAVNQSNTGIYTNLYNEDSSYDNEHAVLSRMLLFHDSFFCALLLIVTVLRILFSDTSDQHTVPRAHLDRGYVIILLCIYIVYHLINHLFFTDNIQLRLYQKWFETKKQLPSNHDHNHGNLKHSRINGVTVISDETFENTGKNTIKSENTELKLIDNAQSNQVQVQQSHVQQVQSAISPSSMSSKSNTSSFESCVQVDQSTSLFEQIKDYQEKRTSQLNTNDDSISVVSSSCTNELLDKYNGISAKSQYQTLYEKLLESDYIAQNGLNRAIHNSHDDYAYSYSSSSSTDTKRLYNATSFTLCCMQTIISIFSNLIVYVIVFPVKLILKYTILIKPVANKVDQMHFLCYIFAIVVSIGWIVVIITLLLLIIHDWSINYQFSMTSFSMFIMPFLLYSNMLFDAVGSVNKECVFARISNCYQTQVSNIVFSMTLPVVIEYRHPKSAAKMLNETHFVFIIYLELVVILIQFLVACSPIAVCKNQRSMLTPSKGILMAFLCVVACLLIVFVL